MNINLPLKTILLALDNVMACDVDESFVVQNITSLQSAGPQDLAIIIDRGEASVFDPVSLEAINKSAAGIFLAQELVTSDKKYILVKDVLAAFTRLIQFVADYQSKHAQNVQIDSSVQVHASAVIESGAFIGAGSSVGAQVFIGNRCVIGKNVILHPGVKILDRCSIGDNTVIHAGTVIGSDGFGYQVGKMGLKKIPQVGIVQIGSDVEIGANCMIDRASFDKTVIGDGVKIDNGVHIAHNVKVGAYSAILAQTGIAGSVEIGIGCQIGGQVAIKDHVKIGNGVKIVSKSGVMHDVKDGEVIAGIPAIAFGQWKRLTIALQRLPDLVKMAGKMNVTPAQTTKSLWQRFFG